MSLPVNIFVKVTPKGKDKSESQFLMLSAATEGHSGESEHCRQTDRAADTTSRRGQQSCWRVHSRVFSFFLGIAHFN